MKEERVLITGITGFVGSHLAEYLLEKGMEVTGTIRWRSKRDNIKHIQDKLKLIETDIRDAHSMRNTIDQVEPDYVFHLAAQSFVPTSWRAPSETISTNVLGTLNLLEAISNSKRDPRILVAGSSEEYGMVYPDEIPIEETNPLRPLSPYAVSKVATDMLGYQYYQSYGIKIVRTRAFNHTGPRRGEPFMTSNFAKQVAEIEKGIENSVIHVGNLEAYRDFTDVRDIVNAYDLAVRKCAFGDVYNICSGEVQKAESVLNMLIARAGIEVKIVQDPERMRPSDVKILKCNSSKFRMKTGWVPGYTFRQTMYDLLDYWRGLV